MTRCATSPAVQGGEDVNNIVQIAIARAKRNRARMNRLWTWVNTRSPKQKDACLRILGAVFEKEAPPTARGR